MHKALREVLGDHVQQKGSLVDAERTRFDFAHNAPMTDEQIARVEAIVNAEILANHATQARLMPIDEAQKSGAMMLFGEKYGDEVRVLDIGSSRELCGGTHVQRTGDIGLFKIVAESGVAAGIRRVEAVTGDNALAYLQSLEATMNGVAGTLKAAPDEVPARLQSVLDQLRALEKELASLKGKLASSQGDELLAQARAPSFFTGIGHLHELAQHGRVTHRARKGRGIGQHGATHGDGRSRTHDQARSATQLCTEASACGS